MYISYILWMFLILQIRITIITEYIIIKLQEKLYYPSNILVKYFFFTSTQYINFVWLHKNVVQNFLTIF